MIEYREQDLLGGWSIAVMIGRATLGHIRRHGQGDGFVYYKGAQNQLNWSLQAESVEALKKEIERSLR